MHEISTKTKTFHIKRKNEKVQINRKKMKLNTLPAKLLIKKIFKFHSDTHKENAMLSKWRYCWYNEDFDIKRLIKRWIYRNFEAPQPKPRLRISSEFVPRWHKLPTKYFCLRVQLKYRIGKLEKFAVTLSSIKN